MTVMGDVMKDTARTAKARAIWKKYSSAAALLFLAIGIVSGEVYISTSGKMTVYYVKL
jgi:hypothetical protein